MDAIIKNLSDPSWWFTAIFAAIIAAVVGAYLKDSLGWITRYLPARYRDWQQKRQEREVAWINEVAADATVLLIENIRAARFLVLFFGTTVIYIGFNILLILKMSREVPEIAGNLASLFFGLVSIYAGYMAVSQVVRVNLATKRYRAAKSSTLPTADA